MNDNHQELPGRDSIASHLVQTLGGVKWSALGASGCEVDTHDSFKHARCHCSGDVFVLNNIHVLLEEPT